MELIFLLLPLQQKCKSSKTSNMGDQNIRVSTQWEHSITNLLDNAPTTEPGIALRQWVHHQCVENILDLLSWEEDEIKANPSQQDFSLDD